MAGKSRCRNTLLFIGLMVVWMAGCGVTDVNAGTGENVMTGESTAPEDENETRDEAREEQAQEVDMPVNAGQNAEPVGEDTASGRISLSILGDSISTYEGYIPEGFSIFFPYDGEVTDVSQTWWMRLLEDTGMELCSNDSSSGSTCVGDSLSIDNPKYGCSDYRISLLTGEQGKMPDVIIIYMGTNDLLTHVPIGDNDGTRWVEEGEIENFSDAYCLMLDKMASNCPISQIYCCTLAPIGAWDEKGEYAAFTNCIGLTSQDYSERIEMIAKNKGIPVIDLHHCGIEIDNLHIMTSDGTHFTPDGMECVEQAMIDGIKSPE